MVKDANGFSLAYTLLARMPGMFDTYFTDEEAFVMANTIAKLPERREVRGVSLMRGLQENRNIGGMGRKVRRAKSGTRTAAAHNM